MYVLLSGLKTQAADSKNMLCINEKTATAIKMSPMLKRAGKGYQSGMRIMSDKNKRLVSAPDTICLPSNMSYGLTFEYLFTETTA